MQGRGLILVTLCLAALIIKLDIAIVNVALPALVRQLGATTTGLQWVVDAYNLAWAVMGLGAAMMFPATLSLLTNVFTGRRERAVAIGVWGPVPGGHRAGSDYWPVTCSPRWLAGASPNRTVCPRSAQGPAADDARI